MIQSPAGYQGDVRIKRYLDFYQAGYGVAMLSSGTTAFTPASLFAASEPGGWYDPSDLTTLFQDAAGTTPVTAVEQPVGRVLDKSGNGNHLSQSTAAARPVLSARVNLLTYTEDFTNAVWTTGTVNLAAPTKVSADEISFPAVTASNDFSVLRQVFTSVATDYVGSVELKAKAAGDIGKKVGIWVNDGSIVNSTFHTLTADWVRVTVTETTSANATSYLTIGVAGSGFGGGGNQSSCSVNIRRADLRPANAGVGLPAYQRVGAATDYDTTGFPLYLKFDGTDDFLQSSSINFTSTDEMNVFAGVRKLADTPVVGVITELSANLDLNSGSFALLGTRFDSRANSSQWLSKGTVAAPVNYDSFTTPSTRVFACSGDISGDAAVFRQNGTVAGTSSADQGTGNFGNYPLFVGARGGTNYRFNGQIYSLIIRGAATDAATITATETWVNDKTKAF